MPPSNLPEAPKNITPKGDEHTIVERLPPEILAYIFKIGTHMKEAYRGSGGVPDVRHAYCLSRLRQLPFPACVSHVCRRWRRIAIDVPSLWTNLDFTEPHPFEKSKMWLERSKKAPLDLSIDMSLLEDGNGTNDTDSQDDDDQEYQYLIELADQYLDRILDLIIPHVSRWRTFRLSVNVQKHALTALKRLEKCPADPGAPILQTFALYYDSSASFDFSPWFSTGHFERNLPFGGHAPMLRQAVFSGIHIDWKLLIPPSERSALSSLYSIPIFTTNLTDLEFAYHEQDVRPSYEEFITILRCAPNLASLELSYSGPHPCRQESAAQPIFLPNLRYFRLGRLGEEDACALLRLFYAPALKSISLDLGGDTHESYDTFVRQLAAPMPLPDPQPPNFRDLIFLPSSLGSSPNPSSLSEAEENGRFVDPREPKSILHNITEMTLNKLSCSTDSLQHFYSACPNLKRLCLDMVYIPQEFFSAFMEDHAILGCQGGSSNTSLSLYSTTSTTDLMTWPVTPLCKHLESLEIWGNIDYQLIPFVKARRAQGVPIRELNIKGGWRDIVTEEEGRWLIANVRSVEIVRIGIGKVVCGEGDEEGGGNTMDET